MVEEDLEVRLTALSSDGRNLADLRTFRLMANGASSVEEDLEIKEIKTTTDG